MTPDLERIEALAKSATAGPWYVDTINTPYHDQEVLIRTKGEAHPFPSWIAEISEMPAQFNNADFIAACDPQTVLALVARVRELENELKTHKQRFNLLHEPCAIHEFNLDGAECMRCGFKPS